MLRKVRTVFFFAELAAVAVTLAPESYAATIISNLNGNDLTQSAALDTSRNKAMGFSMPVGVDYSLYTVTLRLDVASLTPNPTVQLWSNNGGTGLPSSALITLNNPTINSIGISNYVF